MRSRWEYNESEMWTLLIERMTEGVFRFRWDNKSFLASKIIIPDEKVLSGCLDFRFVERKQLRTCDFGIQRAVESTLQVTGMCN